MWSLKDIWSIFKENIRKMELKKQEELIQSIREKLIVLETTQLSTVELEDLVEVDEILDMLMIDMNL